MGSLPPCGGGLGRGVPLALLPVTGSNASQNLMHVDDNTVRMTGGGGDEDVLHQPAVFFGAGLEFRHGAEVDQLGIDRLAALELLQQLDRPKADALVLDIDHRAVVGLEGILRFEVDQFVGTDNLEVRAERQHLAVDLASYLATDDGNDAADAVAYVAGRGHLRDARCDGEDVFCLERRCHPKPPNAPSCASAARWRAAERRSGSRGARGP